MASHSDDNTNDNIIFTTKSTKLDVHVVNTQKPYQETGGWLDWDYIENHHRIIAVDYSRQKELNANPKAIQQAEFVGRLKKNRRQW